MDCDRVFTLLTAAPFPTGTSLDGPVEDHVQACESCRRLAAALAPADDSAPERLASSERRGLPGYAGRVDVGQYTRVVSAHAGAAPRLETRETAGTTARFPHREGRLASYDFSAPNAQLAAYTLTPARRRSTLWDAISLAGFLLAVAVGGWGLGLLAM